MVNDRTPWTQRGRSGGDGDRLPGIADATHPMGQDAGGHPARARGGLASAGRPPGRRVLGPRRRARHDASPTLSLDGRLGSGLGFRLAHVRRADGSGRTGGAPGALRGRPGRGLHRDALPPSPGNGRGRAASATRGGRPARGARAGRQGRDRRAPPGEWHARATRGWDLDTWHDGRFLERWADSRVPEALRVAFGRYDPDDLGRALVATADLFRWLAMETATSLGYPYPALADSRAMQTVATLLRNSPQPPSSPSQPASDDPSRSPSAWHPDQDGQRTGEQ